MIATADLMDVRAAELQSCELQLKDYGGKSGFHGSIRTVSCREDSTLIRQVLSETVDGAVLVVDGGGSLNCTLLGDAMAEMAIANGWAGIVIHGAVRDVAILRTLPIGVKALGSNPRKSTPSGAGDVDRPVSFGGVTFTPGGHLYADEDGFVVAARPVHGELAPHPGGA